ESAPNWPKKCIASCRRASSSEIRQMFLRLLSIFALATTIYAQSATPSPSTSPEEETIIPTFETQKLARSYILDIPWPRGQSTDRTGLPLAQNKITYNLAISFPTPLDFTDAKALAFAREKIDKAAKLTGRSIKISDDAILRHYHNRGILPLEIAQNLSKSEYEGIKDRSKDFLVVRPIYVRTYPNGKIAGQIIGYTGKTGRNLDGIIDNHETLWPETEGRDGLEQTFNELLAGKHGEYKLTFDKDGRKTSEKVIKSAVPGNNIVTTLDLRLQQLAEKALESKAKRGAIVIVDPTEGDILAMASWPTYDPNLFVPSISAAKFKQLQDDPDLPLLPRAFRSAYPPGSTFKLGFGAKCGIPLRGEAEGRIPNDEYMKATHGRKLLNGDIANLSIGQGDTQVTPLQMAQAMAIVANGGRFYQTRLVRQVQSLDHDVVTAYQLREKRSLDVSSATMEEVRAGMIEVVNGPNGTGHGAQMAGGEVAGKTGTAQWGPKNKERTAAWFAGFLPAEEPKYAFAAVYEGDVGSRVHGGTTAAPMIAD